MAESGSESSGSGSSLSASTAASTRYNSIPKWMQPTGGDAPF